MTYFINFLTLSRIFLGGIIFFLLTKPESYFLAFLLFFVAGMTDYFDGYLARKYNLTSEICLLYTSPSPRDRTRSRMPSSA